MGRKKEEKSLKIIGLEEKPIPVHVAPVQPKMSFDAWWLLAQQRIGLPIELKDAVKKHFQACGFMKTGDFEKGLEHFGIK